MSTTFFLALSGAAFYGAAIPLLFLAAFLRLARSVRLRRRAKAAKARARERRRARATRERFARNGRAFAAR